MLSKSQKQFAEAQNFFGANVADEEKMRTSLVIVTKTRHNSFSSLHAIDFIILASE
jgi:hypothetical protein